MIALLLLADASLAVLGRVQQQLHLISLTMPLKLAATMLILSATVVLAAGIFRIADDIVGTAGRRHSADGALIGGRTNGR